MIVSYDPAFIYSRVPKTASTSLRAALEPYRRPQDSALLGKIGRRIFPSSRHPHLVNFRAHAHLPLAAAEQILPAEFFGRALKIVSVRHPLDWAQSLYRHIVRSEGNGRFRALYGPFYSDPTPAKFVQFLAQHPVPPQSAYAIGRQGEMLADFVVRLETLEEDVASLSDKLSAELSVPKLNNAPNAHPLEWSAEERAILMQTYAVDFQRFGYDETGLAQPVSFDATNLSRRWAARIDSRVGDIAIADFRPDIEYSEMPEVCRWAG